MPLDSWCEFLTWIDLAMNFAVNILTGKSPCKLVFGTFVQLPIDFIIGSSVSNDTAHKLAEHV